MNTKKMAKCKYSINKKAISIFFCIFVLLGITALYKNIQSNHVFKIEQGGEPNLETTSTVPDFSDNKPLTGWNPFHVASTDISNVDFSNAGEKIDHITFDDKTIFPSADKMPSDFDPQKILEEGKNPGLGVRGLHAKGITGKGVTVAVIDMPLLTSHSEIKDNLIHYEEIGFPDNIPAVLHGPAVSSLLCGKTVGVAPDAKLVFFASSPAKYIKETDTWEMDEMFENDVKTLEKIYKMNKKLPKDKRISAVSISRGEYHGSKNLPAFKEIVNKLIESGVMVLSVNSIDIYDNDVLFGMLYKKQNSADDDLNSFKIVHSGCMFDTGDCLFAPGGGRTIASSAGNSSYMYYGMDGGWSWATPYIVGVYALAKQVYPDLMPKEFFKIAKETGYIVSKTPKGYNNIIIQPTKIIEYLQNKK